MINKNFAFLLTIAAILTFWVSCSKDNSVGGGGGIETVAKTGKFVNEYGEPASNVEVSAYPDDYNPISGKNSNKISIDTTNDSGFYKVKIAKNTVYNIIGISLDDGRKSLLKDVSEETLISEDTIKITGTMAIYLPEWLKDDTGYVFIPGTNLYASLSDTVEEGLLLINNMPAGTVDDISFYSGIGNDTTLFDEESVIVNSDDTAAIQAFGIIKQYSVSSGHLLSDTVHTIIKDIYGNKWYGTGSGGVAKFDGADWEYFTTVNSNLKVNHVYDLWASENGDVWAGTVGGGVAKFDGENWHVYDRSNSDLINDSVYVVCGCSACGGVWLGTDYGLMYKPDSSGSPWEHYHTGNSKLVGDSIFSLVLNTCGRMFIGTDNGVSFWNGETWTIWTPANSGLPGSIVYGLIDGQNGTLWAATDGGVAIYNGASWKKIDPPVIDHDDCYRALAVSSEGELWAGSSGRIGTVLRSKNGVKLLLSGPDIGLASDLYRINDIFPTESGKVEIATHYDGVLVLGETHLNTDLNSKTTFSKRLNWSRRF